jgi:hypothetical protein
MARVPGKPPLSSPAAVAVHDDGNVTGNVGVLPELLKGIGDHWERENPP